MRPATQQARKDGMEMEEDEGSNPSIQTVTVTQEGQGGKQPRQR
jgi:hypothetical protein